MPKKSLSLINRPLSDGESSSLLLAGAAEPGVPIVLFVCQEGWGDFPVDRVFSVTVRAPDRWDHDALADIIRQTLIAGHERDGAHLDYTNEPHPYFRHYCQLHFGRHIEREGGREAHVDRKTPFLLFRTPKNWYAVALPVFPAQAVVDMLSDDGLSATLSCEFLTSPTVVERGHLGPYPQVIHGRAQKSRGHRHKRKIGKVSRKAGAR